MHPRAVLGWDKDVLGRDGVGGEHDGSLVLLARDRNSESESFQVGFLARDMRREV